MNADETNDFKVGMRLLEVNGTNLIGVTSKEAIDAFAKVGHVLRLLVCNGWNRTGSSVLTSDPEEKSVQFSPSPPPTTSRSKKVLFST